MRVFFVTKKPVEKFTTQIFPPLLVKFMAYIALNTLLNIVRYSGHWYPRQQDCPGYPDQ